MLVEKYKLGNTTIEIYDDCYENKTKDDVEKILKRLEEIGSRALIKQVGEGASEYGLSGV